MTDSTRPNSGDQSSAAYARGWEDAANIFRAVTAPCGCSTRCGDDGDVDGPGVCKGLPVKKEPLVEIVMVHRGR